MLLSPDFEIVQTYTLTQNKTQKIHTEKKNMQL